MNTRKLIRRANERPTFRAIEHRIGDAVYNVFPSGTVYRKDNGQLRRLEDADAVHVLRRVYEAQNSTEEMTHG